MKRLKGWLKLALILELGFCSSRPLAHAASPITVSLNLSNSHFYSGEPFALNVVLENRESNSPGVLLVALEVEGELWLWPQWQQYPTTSFGSSMNLNFGRTTVPIFEPMPWPEVDYVARGLKFYAVFVDPTLSVILSNLAEVTWGFGPHGGGLSITPEATIKSGPIGDGAWLLPTGRIVEPLGALLELDSLPMCVAVSPDGRYALTICSGPGNDTLSVIELESATLVQRISKDHWFFGLVLNRQGDKVYTAGAGGNVVRVYDFRHGVLSAEQTWPIAGFPAGMALAPDESVLYVVCQGDGTLKSVDPQNGQVLGTLAVGTNPYTVVCHPELSKVYVTVENENVIKVIDIAEPSAMTVLASIAVLKNPEAMVIDAAGARMYVTASDEDAVQVVDLATESLLTLYNLHDASITTFGSSPNAVALSPAGDRLYIAEASENKITVLDLADGRIIGAVPTAWYPTAVALTPDGAKLVMISAKGFGVGPSSSTKSLANRGSISIAPLPDDATLRLLEEKIAGYNSRPSRLFDIDPNRFDNPVPFERGGPTPIKHVLFVVRENKTYDALLGDWPKGDGRPDFCLYCGDVTPNLHALVDAFASGDNYYSNAEASIQGHEMMTGAISNTFIEKQWALKDRSIPLQIDVFLNPVTFPKSEYIFQNALNHGITFRDYGEAVGMGIDWLILDPTYVHWSLVDPPVYWTFSRDVDKMASRIEEWESGIFPQLIFMLLPNDHTLGCTWPFPEPRSMVADNDEATGRLVDWVSHSKYWPETVIFVIEDDPQQGQDHVEVHRSILLIASPWVKRGYVSNVHYCEANLHATLEHILGLPPMTIYDETAQPMYDLFTSSPDFTPYDYIPRLIPEQPCLPGTDCAQRSKGKNFLDPDEAEGLQETLWEHERERITALEQADLAETAERVPYNWREVYETIIAPAWEASHE